jgi:predicted aspartyl protease
MRSASRVTPYALRCLRYAPCLLFLACAAPRLTIRPAADTGFRIAAPVDAPSAWQLAARGDFARAASRLSGDTLAQGLVDLHHARPTTAEQDFRAVLDSHADSAQRSLAYVGLEALFLSREFYASLESLELRAAREHLEYDSTNRFVAEALNRLGRMEIEAGRSKTSRRLKLSPVGVPTVRASANGRPERDFWLDTGASMNVVTASFARAHGVRIISEKTGAAGTSTRRKVSFRMGAIDSLRLGSLVLRNVPVIVLRDQDLTFRLLFITLLKVDAIIGWPVISRFVTTLDYPERTLTLEYRPPPDAATRQDGPIAPGNLFFAGQPYARVAVDSSGPLNFILDTGASTSMITRPGLDKLLAAPAQAGGMGCIGGAGGGDAGKIRTLRSLRLTVAGQELFPQTLMVHELPTEGLAITPDGILGEDVLRNFRVTVNAANGKLTLER